MRIKLVMASESHSGRSVAPREVPGRHPGAGAALLAIGGAAAGWQKPSSAAQRIRSKLVRTVESAAVAGVGKVDAASGVATISGQFAGGDLLSITGNLAAAREIGDSEVMIADEACSAQR
jgi:hypothetical protein